jgi:hypothetical protein
VLIVDLRSREFRVGQLKKKDMVAVVVGVRLSA